jgi:hypothetical protein
MDYLKLCVSIAFALGAFLWYRLHKDNMKVQKEKWGTEGFLTWDEKLKSFLIILFCIIGCMTYMCKFLTS